MNLIQKAIICRAGFEDIQLKSACVRGFNKVPLGIPRGSGNLRLVGVSEIMVICRIVTV